MRDLRALARALGGEVNGGAISAPGPGHSPHDRSLRIFLDWQAPGGVRVHSHANDDWQACRDYVLAKLGLSDYRPIDSVPPVKIDRGDDICRRQLTMRLWEEARRRSSLLEAYFASRALDMPTCDDIRFHSACPFRLADDRAIRLPTMIALMRDVVTNEPCGVHRTALRADGSGKADMPDGSSPKKMLGRAKNAAIKIDPDEMVTIGLHIAEGIESALAARQLGYAPMWALGTAGAIARFPVLAGLKALTILADDDPAGRLAAEACAERWEAAGTEVLIGHAIGGGDANDALGRLRNGA